MSLVPISIPLQTYLNRNSCAYVSIILSCDRSRAVESAAKALVKWATVCGRHERASAKAARAQAECAGECAKSLVLGDSDWYPSNSESCLKLLSGDSCRLGVDRCACSDRNAWIISGLPFRARFALGFGLDGALGELSPLRGRRSRFWKPCAARSSHARTFSGYCCCMNVHSVCRWKSGQWPRVGGGRIRMKSAAVGVR